MGASEDVSVDVDVDADRGHTVVVVSGTHDAALMVESASGEQVYLPPDEEEVPDRTPARGASPYESASAGATPYEASDDPYQAGDGGGDGPSGVEPTADGFRVVHPEPVTDFRFVRSSE